MEAPLKDLIELGVEVAWPSSDTFSIQDNATAAGIHNFYGRATSGAIMVSTTSVNIAVTRLKFDNLFGCRLVISEVDPTNRSKCHSSKARCQPEVYPAASSPLPRPPSRPVTPPRLASTRTCSRLTRGIVP